MRPLIECSTECRQEIDNYGISDYSDVAATSSTSKSVISQRFIKASAEEAKKLLTRRLDGLVIPIIRGLDYEQGILAVIDGSKALRKALKDVYGE